MRNIKFLILFFSSFVFSQSKENIEFFKSKFFQYPSIGVDSALYYTNKIFSSKNNMDVAFAYAAKRQLLELKKVKFDDNEYLKKIDFHLKQKDQKRETYYFDLANIHNIKGNTFKLMGNLKASLNEFITAEKYANYYNDVKQILKIKGNLATIKGDLNLFDESISDFRKLLKIIETNKNIEEKEYYDFLYDSTNLNLGVYYIELYKLNKKQVSIDSATHFLNSIDIKNVSDDFKASVFAKKAILNFEIKNYKLADQNFLKSIYYFDRMGLNYENETNYFNLGLSYFHQNRLEESKKYFLKIIKDDNKDNNYNYLFSLKYLANIYTAQKNDSSSIYLNKFIELYEKEGDVKKKEIAASYNIIEKKNLNEEIDSLKKTNQIVLYAIIGIVLFAFIIFFINQKRNKIKIRKKVQELRFEMEHKKSNKKQVKINDENEAKIINGLNKLENEKYFLSKNFNLHNVSKKIGTNTTYLSKVVQDYKNVSFNDYTNDLRIDFILKDFSTNKKLHNYTTQSLAEHVGYKNGDSFAKIFKEKTGLTPYQFIKNL
jgi:AraC-like DNA-binding protein